MPITNFGNNQPLKKYSPDQERDDHGRFAGNGNNVVSSPTIEERAKNYSIPAGWNSDVAKYVSAHPELKMFDNLRKSSAEQKDFLQKQFGSRLNSLSVEQQKSIATYLEHGASLNSYLINLNAFDKPDASPYVAGMVQDAKNLTDAINSSQITENVILERGIANAGGEIDNPNVGDVFTGNGGVISTTIQPSIAEQFASGMYEDGNYQLYHGGDTVSTIWHIYAPAGTTALGININGNPKQVSEGEVVLPSDTKFEILGKMETSPTSFMNMAQMTNSDTEPVTKVTHIWAKVVS